MLGRSASVSGASKSRRYPRVELPQGFLVTWHGRERQDVSRVRTVSLGGLFINTPEPLPVGSLIVLRFELPDGEVRARAIVRASVAGEGMGVEFTGMGYEDRARLRQVLTRLLR